MEQIVEWSAQFLKNKDLFKKEIIEIRNKEQTIEIQKKSTVEIIVPYEKFVSEGSTYKEYDKIWIIFNKKKDTPQTIANNWDKLQNSTIWIIVADLKTGSKWLLHPTTHAKIVEPKQLKTSLQTLQDNC